jgi:hypothetical protein
MAVIKKEKGLNSGYKPKDTNVIKLVRFLKTKDGKHDKLG